MDDLRMMWTGFKILGTGIGIAVLVLGGYIGYHYGMEWLAIHFLIGFWGVVALSALFVLAFISYVFGVLEDWLK